MTNRSTSPNRMAVAIDHRVERVVNNGPDHRGAEYEPRKLRDLPGLRRERHWYCPAKSRAEHELGYGKVALHERVRDRQYAAYHCQQAGEIVEHRCQPDGDQRKCDEQRKRFHRRNGTRSDRPCPRAFDIGIYLAIGIVVENAAGRAHDDHTNDENHEQALVRTALASQPQRPECRPQQKPDADRLVETHELSVVT